MRAFLLLMVFAGGCSQTHVGNLNTAASTSNNAPSSVPSSTTPPSLTPPTTTAPSTPPSLPPTTTAPVGLTNPSPAPPTKGTQWYVRPDSAKYGSANGTNWSNAWSGVGAINFGTVACGDVIWLAGGIYTSSLRISKKCTSTSPIYIYRVLSTDALPTASLGWNTSFDSQVILRNGGIVLGFGAYYIINGRGGSVSSNNFGISAQCTDGSFGCDVISEDSSGNSGVVDHVTLSYLEIVGPTCVTSGTCGGSGASGINLARGGITVSSLLIDHLWVHQFGELIRTNLWQDCVIQYSSLSDTHNDGEQHEDIIYNYAQKNFTMKYNRIWGSPNDGIFFDFGGTNGFYFYDNVYYHSGGQLITFKSGYTLATNLYYYNNVFENDGTFGDFQPAWLDFSGANSSSGEIANNVFENIYLVSVAPNANHNAYNLSGDSDGGTGSFYYTAGKQFVNESASAPSAADFHLTTAGATTFGVGKVLTAPYNINADGTTRGATGPWALGAY